MSKKQLAVTVPLAQVRVHPKNPRRKAVADEGLIASIKASGIRTPIIAVPDLDKNDAGELVSRLAHGQEIYVVAVDGHRRRDGARKARLKEVPVVIQTELDTEAKQVEAMLLANVYREDLTPVEEAEGYQQLLELKYRQGDIAKALGVAPKQVSKTLKLLKLPKPTQTKVHAGQLSLDDATAILEFADDPDTRKKLERAASSDSDFRYALAQARRRRDLAQKVAAAAADLEARGVRRVDWKDYEQQTGRGGATTMVDVRRTPLADPGEHGDCLAFTVRPAGEWNSEELIHLCTDRASHDGQLSAEEQQRRAEADERKAAAERERAEDAAVRDVRLDLLKQAFATSATKLPRAVEDVVRAGLPAAIDLCSVHPQMSTYEELVVPEGATWTDKGWGSPAKTAGLRDHLDDFSTMSSARLAECLHAFLVALADAAFTATHVNPATAAPYAALLDAAGHTFPGPDAARRDRLQLAEPQNTEDGAA